MMVLVMPTRQTTDIVTLKFFLDTSYPFLFERFQIKLNLTEWWTIILVAVNWIVVILKKFLLKIFTFISHAFTDTMALNY